MTTYDSNDSALFDEPAAHARRTDPETSHAAAASVKDITRKQYAVLWVLGTYGALADIDLALYYEGAHERYSAGIPKQSESGLRTRRSELVARRLVEDSGSRHLTVTGRQCIVWRITPLGRARLLNEPS